MAVLPGPGSRSAGEPTADDAAGAASGGTGALTSDAALARSAAMGDRDAFEAIVRRHGPAMFRFARRTLGDDGDAQEVVQDAFVAAWQQLSRWRGDAALRTWLFSVVSHKAVDRQRRRRLARVGEDALEQVAAGPGYDPEAQAAGSDLAAALEVELGRLPESQRTVWLLREVEGLSYADIAEVTGTGAEAVRGQLTRARRTLSERLERWR